MNYGELKTYLRNHVKRPSGLEDYYFDRWNEVVAADLTNRLRLNSYVKESLAFTPSSNPFTPAATAIQVLEVRDVDSSINYTLKATSKDLVIRYTNETGSPRVYNTQGNSIRVAPYAEGLTLDIVYRDSIAKLDSDSDTEPALTEQPEVYINAFLCQIYSFLRDPEAEAACISKLAMLINNINRSEGENTASENMMQQGASSWL